MAAGSSSTKVIYAALAGNLLVALTKFIAAIWTGSSAMLSEGIHSLVDTGNQLLMLYGIHRSARPPDEEHPLGYGRELYFWSFIVALLIFALGAGMSFYEGVTHIRRPVEISSPIVNYVVLGASFIFEGSTWWVALREFGKSRGKFGYFEAVTRSKDPTSFIVLFEDTAALVGIVTAFAGNFAAEKLNMPVLDGVASIGIGVVLAATALLLARESKGLLIGEPAREQIRQSILAIVSQHPGVRRTGRLITVHLAPRQIVAILDVDFADSCSASDVERLAGVLEQRIKEKLPDVVSFFVNPKQMRDADSGTMPQLQPVARPTA